MSDVFVVEHVDSSKNKFGLRKKITGNVTSNDNTTIFKADNDKIQQRWVKKLRELTMEMQHNNGGKKSTTSLGKFLSFYHVSPVMHSKKKLFLFWKSNLMVFLDHLSLTPSNSNRNSRASRDSCELSHTTTTTEDGQSIKSQDLSTVIGMANNNNKSEQISFRLSQWPNDDNNGT